MLALIVANAAFAGGGMRLGGKGRLDDGTLQLSWVEKAGPLRLLLCLRALYRSGLAGRQAAREIEILDPATLHIEIDGETLARPGPYRLRILPGILPVCVPKPR